MAKLSEFLSALALMPGNAGGKIDIGVSSAGIPWLKLTSANGTAAYVFVDNSGDLKIHTAEPTADDDGSVVGTQS